MKIISDFIDYYDCCQNGTAKEPLYKRFQKQTKYSFPIDNIDRWQLDGFTKEHIIIGFCGKIYPVIVMRQYDPVHNRTSNYFCRSIDDITAIINGLCTKVYKKRWADAATKNRNKYSHYYWYKEWFKECDRMRDQYTELFLNNHSPIFVATHNDSGKDRSTYELTWNAYLRPFEFFRVFSTEQAFQEISMWLGRQVEPNKPIPPISDKDMAGIKGFDTKYGFRHRPKSK